MMTEERMRQIAERNARIFKQEWCQKQDGPFNLFQFPLFDFYAEYWVTDSNLDKLSNLAIEYLNEIDRRCAEKEITHANFEGFLDSVARQPNSAAALAWGCLRLFQPEGYLYTERIGGIADELHALLGPDEEEWNRRGKFYVYKAMFLSAMTGVGNMDNPEDVDSCMEYLLKALMHAGGTEIEYSQLDENFIA